MEDEGGGVIHESKTALPEVSVKSTYSMHEKKSLLQGTPHSYLPISPKFLKKCGMVSMPL